MIQAKIAGMGQWIPEEVRTNDAWPLGFAELSKASSQRELIDIEQKASCLADEITLRNMNAEAGDPFLGACERRIASPDITPAEAATHAARAAIKDAGVDPKDIDAVLSWDAVPEFVGPSSSSRVAYLVGAHNAYGVGIDVACASFISQLDLASALIKAEHAKTILLTQTHFMTRPIKMMHPASPTVGDIATAAVVTAQTDLSKGILPMHARSYGEAYYAVLWTRGQKVQNTWYQKGGDFYLGTADLDIVRELVRTTVRGASEMILETLAKSNCPLDEVSALISIQPRKWIPAAIAEAAGIKAPAPTTFDRFCHIGGCGLVANLIKAREMGLLTPQAKTILFGQGAGFIKAAMLILW